MNEFGLRLICVICEICGSASDVLDAAERLREVYSRVASVLKQDVEHIFNMLWPVKKHGAR